MTGASRMYGASRGMGLLPKTFQGSLVRRNLVSPTVGGGRVSASNFASSSIRNSIDNISTPEDIPQYKNLFGDGLQLGLKISYKIINN